MDGYVEEMAQAAKMDGTEGRRAYVRIAHKLLGRLLDAGTDERKEEEAVLLSLARTCLGLADALTQRHSHSPTQTTAVGAEAVEGVDGVDGRAEGAEVDGVDGVERKAGVLVERAISARGAAERAYLDVASVEQQQSAPGRPRGDGVAWLSSVGPVVRTLSPLYLPTAITTAVSSSGTGGASVSTTGLLLRKGRHRQRFSEGSTAALLSAISTSATTTSNINSTANINTAAASGVQLSGEGGLSAVSTFAYVQHALFVPPPRENADTPIPSVTNQSAQPQSHTSQSSNQPLTSQSHQSQSSNQPLTSQSFNQPLTSQSHQKPPSVQQRIPLVPISPLVLSYQETVRSLETATLELASVQQRQSHDASSADLHSLRSLSLAVHDCRNLLALLSAQLQFADQHRSITLLHPDPLAYHLTLIEHALYSQINSQADLLTHSSLRPSNSIQRCMDFFNYFVRAVESSVLDPNESADRAAAIHCWMKVATRLYNLRNFSSLKAIVSALGTAPILRLRKTWALVPKKSLATLDVYRELLSEQGNYQRYRAVINNCRRPAVPFLGVFIYDLTYLGAAVSAAVGRRSSVSSQLNLSSKESSPTEEHMPSKTSTATTPASSNPHSPTSSTTGSILPQDPRIRELLFQFEYFQTGPQYDADPKLAICRHKSHKESYFSATFGPDKVDDQFLCSSWFCLHWILTQTFRQEKTLDDWSTAKEPNKDKKKSANDVRRKSVDYGMLGRDVSATNSIATDHHHHLPTSHSTTDVSSALPHKLTASSSHSSTSLTSKSSGKLNTFLHAIGIGSSTSSSMPIIRTDSPDPSDDDHELDADGQPRRRSRSFLSGDRLAKITENAEFGSGPVPEDDSRPALSPSPSPSPPPASYTNLSGKHTNSIGSHYRSHSTPSLTPFTLPPVKPLPNRDPSSSTTLSSTSSAHAPSTNTGSGHVPISVSISSPTPTPPPPTSSSSSPDKPKSEVHIGSRFRRLASLKPDTKD